VSGEKLLLKYLNANQITLQEETNMDIGGYFQILIGVSMTGTFIALALILLNGYYGKDEEKETEKE
jgi:hypothetical protein